MFILIAGYFKKPDAVIGCMCVVEAAAGMLYAGFQVNMLDIAPRNASVVMGIVNAASNTAGFLSPMLVGFITHNKVRSSKEICSALTLRSIMLPLPPHPQNTGKLSEPPNKNAGGRGWVKGGGGSSSLPGRSFYIPPRKSSM